MFEDVGAKIKGAAIAMFVIEVIAAIVCGCIFINEPYGWIILILGPVIAWMFSIVVYGFGQLVENSDLLALDKRNDASSEKEVIDAEKKEVVVQSVSQQQFSCYSCGNPVNFGDSKCTQCGAAFDWKK